MQYMSPESVAYLKHRIYCMIQLIAAIRVPPWTVIRPARNILPRQRREKKGRAAVPRLPFSAKVECGM